MNAMTTEQRLFAMLDRAERRRKRRRAMQLVSSAFNSPRYPRHAQLHEEADALHERLWQRWRDARDAGRSWVFDDEAQALRRV